MLPNKGLFWDCSEAGQPAGTYRFAKNIISTNLLGVKENEDGFTSLALFAPYILIGVIPVDANNVVTFSTDDADSEIGLVDLDAATYTQIYNDPDLAFSTSSPIQGEYRKDVNGDRIVTWTDVNNTLRILNIDDLSGINDVEDLNAFQDINNPSMSSYSILNTGGSLKTSAIVVTSKYKNRDGSETNWFVHDHVFYINDDATTKTFDQDDGAAPGTVSNKSINFTLSDCDTRYDTIVIGYIQTINNVTIAYKAYERANSTTLDLAITGAETTADVTLDEILTPTANYSTVGSITQLAGQLYAANVTTEPIPDLQQYALDIRIDYTHSLVNVISNTNSHKDSLPPALIPGEVYAFYLGVELNKGGWVFYHIPGRDATSSAEYQLTSNQGLVYRVYQVENTADAVGATTNMGFWKNENEVYPDDDSFDGSGIGGRDLRNTEVLHHRFPTLDYLVSTYYSGNAVVGITDLVRLGISVSNVNIPVDVQSHIKRWKIFFAKKDVNNSLSIGSDLWHPSTPIANDSTIRWTTGGNWALEAEQAGSDDWEDFDPPEDDTLRGHCLDLLYSSSPITPNYARFNYTLKRENLNTQYTGFRSDGARMTFTGEDRGSIASAVIDYTVPTQTTRSGSGFVRRLDNFIFLPQNALSGKFKSQFSEGVFVADVHQPAGAFNGAVAIKLLTNSPNQSGDPEQFRLANGSISAAVGEMTMQMMYYRILSDVHSSFTQQELVPLEGYVDPATDNGTFEGGDGFMCYLSYLACAPIRANPDLSSENEYEKGIRMWKAYIGYSRYNFNYRYQVEGDIGTYFHGKTDVRQLFVPTATNSSHDFESLVFTNEGLNEIKYDSSMNNLNVYYAGVIFNPSIVEATEFPNTIIWSPVQNEESKEFSWRSFPSGNRYVIPKNKGDITNIQGFGNDELLINTTDGFFKTRSNVRVDTSEGEAFLKTASVFDLPPVDITPSESGYAGCQHKFACSLTKAGYVFPDNKRGAIFLYDGKQLEEISNYGMSTFFRDFMDVTTDNPFNNGGSYTTGFDNKLDRLIISKQTVSANTNWTISYDPQQKCWISFHDYTPNYMFCTTSGNLYSTLSSAFFLNREGPKGFYLDALTYPSYIDITFNPDADKSKLAYSVNWHTEVYPNTYTSGQPSSILDYNTTCTHLTVKGADACTGRVTLSRSTSIYDFTTANIRNKNRIWYFDDIRDLTTTTGGFIQGFYSNFDIDTGKLNTNLDWFDQRRFIDKFISCRFEYDNTSNKRWLLLDANAEFTLMPQ